MTEEEINSPTRQTLGMLAVISIMTLCMWVFARGGCNYHPPKESRDPRKVDLVELARDPKDAALEFELRWSTKSWGGAAELARGPMVEQVRQQQKACDDNPTCAQRASELRGKVQVLAELLQRDAMQAVARVTTVGAGPKPERHIIRVERDTNIWKTVSREVDDGSVQPLPPAQVNLPLQSPSGRPGMPQGSARPGALGAGDGE